MSAVHIFIGPRKTGTSWLHHVIYGDSQVKEIRYPLVFGRRYVFKRHVEGRSLLIWPYLIHEPEVLKVLLKDLEASGCQPHLYWSDREESDWTESMSRFLMKYGANTGNARQLAVADYHAIRAARTEIEKTHSITNVKIINPTNFDLKLLATACNATVDQLEKARALRVYETNETARVPSKYLVNLFFRIKPFIPDNFHNITKLNVLRKLFFRRNAKTKSGS